MVLPPDPTSLNQFIERVVGSLESFKEARARNVANLSAKSGQDFIVGLKLAQQDFACASKYLDGFEQSTSPAVRLAVAGLQDAAARLIDLNDVSRNIIVEAMNGQRPNELPGNQADRNAKILMLTHDTWHGLVPATTSAVLSLIEFDPVGQKLRRQALTTQQRAAICKRLIKSFPVVARHGDSTQPLESSAAIAYFGRA